MDSPRDEGNGLAAVDPNSSSLEGRYTLAC
jgi:hypothetical protein